MFIEGLYTFLIFLKNQGQAQYFPVEEVMDALNRAQADKYNAEIAKFEQTARINNAMSPFKENKDIDIASGFFPLPTEYNYHTNISSLVTVGVGEAAVTTEYRGKFFTDGEWLAAKTSELLPPDNKHIKARIINDKIEVVPVAVSKIRLYFLKDYTRAVYAYDPVGIKQVFKTEGSSDIDWGAMEHNDLIMRTFRYLGIPLRDQFFVMAENLIKESASTT